MPPWVLELIESSQKLATKTRQLGLENEKFRRKVAYLRRKSDRTFRRPLHLTSGQLSSAVIGAYFARGTNYGSKP